MKATKFSKSPRITTLIVLLLFALNSQSQSISSYTFSALSGTFTPLTSGTTRTITGGSLDDGYYGNIPLGFVFNYGGSNYTSVAACTNGWISFVSTMTQTLEVNDMTAGLSGARPVIAALWDDLHMSTGTFKTYSDTTAGGTDSVFTAEWLNVRWWYTVTTPVISFQIKLFKSSGRIRMVYRQDSTPVSGASASIGLMGPSLGSGNFISLSINNNPASPTSSTTGDTTTNNVRPATGQIYQFDKPAVCSGIPVGGIASAFSSSVCKSSTNISLIGASGSSGITYQWQDSSTGSSWASASGGAGATTANYTTPILFTPKFYRCLITCTNSSLSAYSTVAAISMGCLNYNVTRTTGITYSSIISTGTTFTWNILSADDGGSDAVMLTPSQFNFSFAGQPLTGFRVCTNGWMTLDVMNTSKEYHNDFATLPFTRVITPLWDDLVVTGNNQTNLTNIRYQIIGSTPGSRVLVVEWYGMEIYNNAGPDLNFQVKLYEGSNNVEIVYGKMLGFDGTNNFTYSYTAGISSSSVSSPILSGQLFTQKINNTRSFDSISNNNHSVVPACNTSILFTPGTYTTYTATGTTPSNDSAGAPIILPVNSSPCLDLCGTYYTSANATASSQVATCTGIADDDVWFKFTAPSSGQVTVTVRGAGGYDPVFQVMNNAYDTAGMGAAKCRNLTGAGLTETVNVTSITPSNNYFIRVYNYTAGSGTDGYFSICVNDYLTPPSNDECSSPAAITMSSTTCNGTTGNTLGATASSQTACSGTPDDDVWYVFVATGTKSRVLVQSGTGFNAQVEVFSGTCSSLTSLKCINNTSTGGIETDSFTTVTSSLYYIRVYHSGAGAGTGNFSICVFNVNAPTTQASSVTFTNTNATSTQVNWTNGNGASRVVVALPITAFVIPPSNYTSYTPNTIFGSGTLLSAGTNNYAVYDATGSTSTVTVTGLAPLTQYSFYVYEYNGTNAAKTYLTPGAGNSITTLPVTFISFTGVKQNNDVLLLWQTASEINNDYFEVERSLDNRQWTTIGKVKGHGTTNSISNYQYSDVSSDSYRNPLDMTNTLYYRLKQIDFNGKYSYSKIILINDITKIINDVSVSPNPTSSLLSLGVNSTTNTDADIIITDVQGRTVLTKKVELIKGFNKCILNEFANFNAGIFFLKITANNETTVVKLIKM